MIDKPADLGTGIVAASFGRDGSWLSIGCVHPAWGFVEVNGLPPFDEADRGDASATRRWRRLMTEPRVAWLRLVPGGAGTPSPPDLDVSTSDPITVAWAARTGRPSAIAFARAGSRTVRQRWELAAGGGVLRATPRLDRPPLAEITEVDPPAETGATTRLRVAGGRLVIVAAALPAVATVDVSAGRWRVVGDAAELRVPRTTRTLEIAVSLRPGVAPRPRSKAPPRAGIVRRRPIPPGWPEQVAARALAYVRGCTALVAGVGERAILTDHRLLPLSWTRDAYYQARLLLVTGEASDAAIVADHLRWLWRRCDRPAGRWMRSHHANGRPKDRVYQADQQLYPFIELADFWRATGALPAGVPWDREARDGWRAVEAAIDPVTGLMPTDELAADDPADRPFVAANQVLLWHAAVRLAEPGLAGRLGLSTDGLQGTADRVWAAFEQHILLRDRWAYATDGRGGTTEYHDANDLPTALAPALGFCPADDPAWRGTIDVAFSPANAAFVDGPDGGLGSRHTPGAWALGHIQAWVAARVRGDRSEMAEALARLERMAFADGMLPEAWIGDRRRPMAVRHWFAWPGSAFALFWLLERRDAWAELAAPTPGRPGGRLR